MSVLAGSWCCAWLLLLAEAGPSGGELICNGSFERVALRRTGMGLMPNEWNALKESPDTYSADGSFGLSPAYPGTSDPGFSVGKAHDGVRWIAAGSNYGEVFGQRLRSPLAAGEPYALSAQMLQSSRHSRFAAGGYDVLLATREDLSDGISLGRISSTSEKEWTPVTLRFVAPPDAASRLWLAFRPFAHRSGTNAYPALDSLSLRRVVQASRQEGKRPSERVGLSGRVLGAHPSSPEPGQPAAQRPLCHPRRFARQVAACRARDGGLA